MAIDIRKVVYENSISNKVDVRVEISATVEAQSIQDNTTTLKKLGTYLYVTNKTASSITVSCRGGGNYLEQTVCYANTSDSIPIYVNGVLGTYPGGTSDTISNMYDTSYGTNTFTVGAGETNSYLIYPILVSRTIYHNIDGTAQLEVHVGDEFTAYTTLSGSYTTLIDGISLTGVIDIPTINRVLLPLTADNFNDEGNPAFNYEITTGKSIGYYMSGGWDKDTAYPDEEEVADTVIGLQAALSFDGETIDIPYRDIPLDKTSYTFDLTDEEREILRQKAQGAPTVPIYYITKVTREIYYTYQHKTGDKALNEYRVSADFVGKAQRNFTVVGCNPSLNSDVWDIKEETLALTGDKDTVIRYESMVEFAVRATASKHAEIVSQSVTCGSKTVSGLEFGVIQDVEDGIFVFKATDSRNLTAEKVVEKNLIEYVKPTCYQKLNMEMSSEFGTRVVLKVNGNYYNGSFGAVNNTLKLETRYTQDDGSMGDWVTLEGTPTFNGNTYSLEVKIEGFSYSKAYTFQCRATDKLNYVQSSQYTLRIYPVFDWGENDFNFNVPVKMNEKTVLRHNADANNTVLSASGGHIYLRPGGTDNTSGEIMIKPDGDVVFGGEIEVGSAATFNGDVNLNGTVLIDGVDLNELLQPEEEEEVIVPADYIIETGTEAMGTNGTWYWTKWNSGKAECYGKRNFGSMAITTKKTDDVYRSATQTQALPSGLFVAAPEFMSLNTYPNGESNYLYTWIGSVSSTAASATSTGGFCVMSCNSQTASSSYITFQIVGRWK